MTTFRDFELDQDTIDVGNIIRDEAQGPPQPQQPPQPPDPADPEPPEKKDGPPCEEAAEANCEGQNVGEDTNEGNPRSVTRFSSCRETTGATITIADFVQGTRCPDASIIGKIAQIRDLVQKGKKKAADKIKLTLPAVTLSGTFTSRRADQLAEHSGIVTLDFDDLSEADMADAWQKLVADRHVLFVFRSPSGHGLKGGCRVPVCEDADDHTSAWLACERYFKDAHGLTLDRSGKDVCRLCFVSHDPDAYVNWQADELDVAKWRPLTEEEEAARRLHEMMDACRYKGIGTSLPEPSPVLSNVRRDILGEAGNLLCLQGMVKSGKTGFISAAIAALVGAPEDADTLGITASPHDGAILHFDCEQGERNHCRLMETIIRKRCRRQSDPPNLHSFSLLDVDLADRWALVEHTTETISRVGPIRCVLFDGGADFLASLNDEIAANEMVDRQVKFARRWECLAVIVIHENPGTDTGKIRGHYGSQLHRKCQAAIVVEKGKDDITSVHGLFLRDGSWPKSKATYFGYDVNAGMHVECKDPIEERKTNKKREMLARLHELAGRVLVEPRNYGDLLSAIEEDQQCSYGTARNRFRDMKDKNVISKNEVGKWQICG